MTPQEIARLEAEARELGIKKTELIRQRVFGSEVDLNAIEQQLKDIRERLDAIEKKL